VLLEIVYIIDWAGYVDGLTFTGCVCDVGVLRCEHELIELDLGYIRVVNVINEIRILALFFIGGLLFETFGCKFGIYNLIKRADDIYTVRR
jgi:hypothetical protein